MKTLATLEWQKSFNINSKIVVEYFGAFLVLGILLVPLQNKGVNLIIAIVHFQVNHKLNHQTPDMIVHKTIQACAVAPANTAKTEILPLLL